ncbi:SMI1/KNR4 family protein [Actinomadura harenae]|uniref:SMI1/KNR4 family protein n=1 Tax=Actinomadura harenae TaxID=2483351 RepID=A0A3M2ME99_9ACTN|nr:SMI1/KNR4 family protein [Actinomadura harenae]RMI47223.1 SMI1/KNR4 family protein [Actinomadura harenae]
MFRKLLKRQKTDSHAPLTEAEVADAEHDLGISFPLEYRDYLLNVSAGGEVELLRRTADGWGWKHQDVWGEQLRAPFPHPDTWAEYEDALWERHPERADLAEDESPAAAMDPWVREFRDLEWWQVAGTFIARSHGCTFNTRMVASGPLAGTMWWEDLGCCGVIVPSPWITPSPHRGP